MSIAEHSRAAMKVCLGLGMATLITFGPAMASAQAAAPAAASAQAAAPAAATAPVAAAPAAPVAAADAYVPMKPTPGKGQPMSGAIGFQSQFSPIGIEALQMHDAMLMPIITVISLLVLGLLLWVMARYNRRSNPVASKSSHNTLLEVVWTLTPVLVLVVMAVPSIRLLAHQYAAPAKDALTIKATGYQWYWGYTYPDNGGFEVISNQLSNDEAIKRGDPAMLGVDNRMVVPVGVDIRMQTTGSDVIHSFSVPALWFKLDAVPGHINERVMHINEPGVYYGQCSQLCGVRHGYMPVVVEALPMAKFQAWVRAQGGTVGKPATPAPATTASAAGLAPAKPAA